MEFNTIIKSIQQEFEDSCKGTLNKLNYKWHNIHTENETASMTKFHFRLNGDSVLLDDNLRLDLYLKFIESEILNICHRLAVTSVTSFKFEKPPRLVNIKDDCIGSLFDCEFNKLNSTKFVSVDSHKFNFGIMIKEGFINMIESIQSLEIVKDDDSLIFKMYIHLTDHFAIERIANNY